MFEGNIQIFFSYFCVSRVSSVGEILPGRSRRTNCNPSSSFSRRVNVKLFVPSCLPSVCDLVCLRVNANKVHFNQDLASMLFLQSSFTKQSFSLVHPHALVPALGFDSSSRSNLGSSLGPLATTTRLYPSSWTLTASAQPWT